MMRWIAVMTLFLALATAAWAQHEPTPAPEAAASTSPATGEIPHPTISASAGWAVPVLAVLLAMFLAAAIIGPIVRASRPPEAPAVHSHDDSAHGDAHGH